MQKKLLAVAVAGALAAPAVALAQSSVTVSGTINVWYETAGASGATNVCPAAGCTVSTYDVKSRDRMQDGTGSNIRFTAVEDVGAGMQAFAQIETAVMNNANNRNDALGGGATSSGWGNRNSGVGLRGQAWGEVLIGVWDIHYNEQFGTDGLLVKGASHMSMLGLMNSFGMAGSASGGIAGASIGTRYSNVLRYQSPNWGGFSFRASYARPSDGVVPTATNQAPGAANVTEGTKNKVVNFAPQFNMGGIHVGFSYLKDSDISTAQSTFFPGATITNQAGVPAGGIGPVLANTVGSAGTPAAANNSNLTTITSNRLHGAYTFPFGLKLGLVYDDSKIEMKSSGVAPGFGTSKAKRTVWGGTVVYTIGAHTIGGSYAQAGKLTGDVGQPGGAASISLSDIGVTSVGAAAGSAPQSYSDNSKAKFYVVGYTYDLSKRTNIHAAYSQIKNDNLAGYDFFANGVTMSGAAGNWGADPRIIHVGLRHSF